MADSAVVLLMFLCDSQLFEADGGVMPTSGPKETTASVGRADLLAVPAVFATLPVAVLVALFAAACLLSS